MDATAVIVPLLERDASAIADALETLAGIDEGENTNRDDLLRLATVLRGAIEEARR